MGILELKFKEKWIGVCPTCKKDDAIISLISDPYCLECFNQPLDVWDTWKKPDGSIFESFTIITTEPDELMRPIHRRMPVILSKEDEQSWLDCSANPFDKVQSFLKPFPADLMAAHEISKRINNPKYDAADCSAPVEGQRSRRSDIEVFLFAAVRSPCLRFC